MALEKDVGDELVTLIVRELKIACNWDANVDTAQIERFPMSSSILELSQALRNVIEITDR